MNKKVSNFVKKELSGVKSLAKDLIPRFANLLDPQVWQSPETIKAGLINIATDFLGSRIGGMLEDISKDKNVDPVILESQQSKQVLLKLAKFAAQENPDVEVWDAAKRIFIRTLQKDFKAKERASLYEMIDICEELKGSELRILAGAYHIFETLNSQREGNSLDVRRWATEISEFVGFETFEEVLRHEDNLVKQKLISPREVLRGDVNKTWESDSSQWHRLTRLGLKLCEILKGK